MLRTACTARGRVLKLQQCPITTRWLWGLGVEKCTALGRGPLCFQLAGTTNGRVTGSGWAEWVRWRGQWSQPIQGVATTPSAGGWGPAQWVARRGTRGWARPPSGGISTMELRQCRLNQRWWGLERRWLHWLLLGEGLQRGLAWGALWRGPRHVSRQRQE